MKIVLKLPATIVSILSVGNSFEITSYHVSMLSFEHCFEIYPLPLFQFYQLEIVFKLPVPMFEFYHLNIVLKFIHNHCLNFISWRLFSNLPATSGSILSAEHCLKFTSQTLVIRHLTVWCKNQSLTVNQICWIIGNGHWEQKLLYY